MIQFRHRGIFYCVAMDRLREVLTSIWEDKTWR
jgi:hypothetical protein